MKRALILIAACGHAAPAPTPSNHAPATAPARAPDAPLHGQVFDSCGPVDGPATTILLTSTDIGCKEQSDEPYTRIEVWSGSRTGTVDLSSGGNGMRCPNGQDCENADTGTLDWGDATHPPRYTMRFPDGTTESGTFTITSCDFPHECG